MRFNESRFHRSKLVFSRIYHFLKGPNPLHPSVWKGRLSPLTFRRFVAADLQQCLELYALNEPGRFPKGVAEQYEQSLVEHKVYVLVVEKQGRIVASGGMCYLDRDEVAAVFSFGLVRPDHHGHGIGTALLLARLALLKPKPIRYCVFIFAVERSIAFYRRFGFKVFPPWQDLHGERHPSGLLVIGSSGIRGCRALLRDHEIRFPDDEAEVPFQK